MQLSREIWNCVYKSQSALLKHFITEELKENHWMWKCVFLQDSKLNINFTSVFLYLYLLQVTEKYKNLIQPLWRKQQGAEYSTHHPHLHALHPSVPPPSVSWWPDTTRLVPAGLPSPAPWSDPWRRAPLCGLFWNCQSCSHRDSTSGKSPWERV